MYRPATMRSPSPTGSYDPRPSATSRAIAALLSGAIGLFVVLVLLRMGALAPDLPGGGAHLVSVSLSHSPEPTHQRKRAPARLAAAATPPPAPRQIVPVQPIVPPLHLLALSKDELAAADISHMARHAASAGGGAGGGGAAYGPGEGPGGARLYNAEWYREPSDAEIGGYMPAKDLSGGAWAMIACKTEEHYRVDDCQELSESPPGSGLARALRRAAWQFLVRPPRIDGKPLIGAWVRIRFDFTARGGGEAGAEGAG